jgi:GT2 family glycosyltransferase
MNASGVPGRAPEQQNQPRHHSVYAVMLNWNSFDYNAACIESLKESTYPFAKIVVVDNGSKDGSIDRLEAEYRDPQMVFVRNAKNEGFAGGMNIAMQQAFALGADLVFSINNDTVVDPDCLRSLVQALDADPSAGIAGPSIMYYKNPDRIWLVGGYFNKLRAGIVVPGKGKTIQEIPTSTTRVTFLTGCAILLRRSVFEQVGKLDTSYFFYSEDLDYDLRVVEAGMTLLFVPTAKVWHKIDEVATDRTSPYVLYHLARSTVLVFRRRFSAPYRWYGVFLQFALYTPFRFWQILRGGAGRESYLAWLKGLWAGTTTELEASMEGSRSPNQT